MDVSGTRQSEAYTGHKPVPLKIAMKVLESICKVTVEINKGII